MLTPRNGPLRHTSCFLTVSTPPDPRSATAHHVGAVEVREDLKSENLSFTDIAKRVGENWQQLSSTEKALYENHAVAAKEKFKADLVEYKKTDQYRVYNEYLAAFKIKHGRASGIHVPLRVMCG